MTRGHAPRQVADPAETADLAADPSHQAALMQCMAEMLRWRARHLEHSMTHLSVGPMGAAAAYPTLHEATKAQSRL